MKNNRDIYVSGITFISLLIALLLFLPLPAHGSHVRLTLQEIVQSSDTIVHGAVVATSAKWVTDGRGRHIYTYATLNCFKYLKATGDQPMVVEWPGGTVERITEQVSESQPLHAGEEVVLFLTKELRPAVGFYSKSEIVNGLAISIDRAVACTEFLIQISNLTGVKLPGPALAKPSAGQSVRPGGSLVIRSNTLNISIQRLVPAAKSQGVQAEPPSSGPDLGPGDVIYDNTTFQNGWYAPGAAYELLDFGTSPGGQVTQFTFGYVTTLANPGTVTVRFYRGTSTSTPGSLLTGWVFSGLPGSPDGQAHLIAATFEIPADQGFTLPNGAFGYSFQCANANTGPGLATGGTGNADMFWKNSVPILWRA